MAHLPISNSSSNKKNFQKQKYSKKLHILYFQCWKTNKGYNLWPSFEHESGHFYHLLLKDEGVSNLEDYLVTMKLLVQPLGTEED